MARSSIATKNFNTLYNGLRSAINSRGISVSVKTFYDGSAVVNIMVSASNASVTLSTIICAIYENDKIIGYRASNEDKSIEVEDLSKVISFCRNLVADTRIILSKI